MIDRADFPLVTHPLLGLWLMVMRRMAFRGTPRISSLLVRFLLPDRCITRSARGYFMAIRSTEYVEACALCDCLNRQLTSLTSFLLRDGDFVIDGGANIGQFTLLAASIVGKEGKVLAFEPNPIAMNQLQISQKKNGFTWVELRLAALGYEQTTVQFYLSAQSQLSSLYNIPQRLGSHEVTLVQQVRLDDELAAVKWNLSRIRLVKLDLEGGELEALRGAQSLLDSADPPALLVELNTVARPDGLSAVDKIRRMFQDYHFAEFFVSTSHFYLENRLPQLGILPAYFYEENLAVDVLFVKSGSTSFKRVQPLISK